MIRAGLLVSAGLVGILAAFDKSTRDALSKAGDTIAQAGDSIATEFNLLRLSLMRGIDPATLNNANVRAFLTVIRTGEGTADAGGFSRLFGGGSFSSFADHPRQTVCKPLRSGGRLCSTAAGAFQALASTWDETSGIMGLADFSPRNQELFAIGRLAARGALDDVIAGRFSLAIGKAAKEWASLPGSPYGQPVITMARAEMVYQNAGGYDLGSMA